MVVIMIIEILPKQNDNTLCSNLLLGIKRKCHLFAPWLWQKLLDCFHQDLQQSASFHLFISNAHLPEQIWDLEDAHIPAWEDMYNKQETIKWISKDTVTQLFLLSLCCFATAQRRSPWEPDTKSAFPYRAVRALSDELPTHHRFSSWQREHCCFFKLVLPLPTSQTQPLINKSQTSLLLSSIYHLLLLTFIQSKLGPTASLFFHCISVLGQMSVSPPNWWTWV